MRIRICDDPDYGKVMHVPDIPVGGVIRVERYEPIKNVLDRRQMPVFEYNEYRIVSPTRAVKV